ncbi:hypothetical protein [Castellaniella sp.]|uniref:hypothetical protein n=1 Tax=Castellaniella sp. TaxID=1955812 RepID=UPI00355D89AE
MPHAQHIVRFQLKNSVSHQKQKIPIHHARRLPVLLALLDKIGHDLPACAQLRLILAGIMAQDHDVIGGSEIP